MLERRSNTVIRTTLASTILIATAVAQEDSASEHPVRLDRTGIAWYIPFESARIQATESNCLIAIKPVAFGTTPDGCW